MIPVPSLPQEKLGTDLEKYVRKHQWLDQVKKLREQEFLEGQDCQRLERTRHIATGLLRSLFFPIEMFPSALGGVVRYAQSSRIDMGRSPKGITRRIDLHAPSTSET